ncbi:MAG: thermonuclease family protein [Candidatus Aenigmatarchaeota archaeon]
MLFIGILFVSFVKSAYAYECIVERIIDGDTFICSGQKVRLIGVDAPESRYNQRVEKQRSLGDREMVINLGKEAKRFVEGVLKKEMRVRLEFDVQTHDRYGRLLAYVWLPNGEMLNELILREGYAMLLTVPPNVKYQDRFQRAFREAREKERGLWKR